MELAGGKAGRGRMKTVLTRKWQRRLKLHLWMCLGEQVIKKKIRPASPCASKDNF